MMTPEATLFCIPYAGGNAFSYKDFSKYMPGVIEVVRLELPGHGARGAETLLSSITAMALEMVKLLRAAPGRPYALYGHSMGALVAYEAVRLIAGDPVARKPVHLFLTGRAGPGVPPKGRYRAGMSHHEFMDLLRWYGGFPEKALDDPHLMEFLEPILRNDFHAVETYRHDHAVPLGVPATVMIGAADDCTREEAMAWGTALAAPPSFRIFPGGHFFVFNHTAEVCADIARTMLRGMIRR